MVRALALLFCILALGACGSSDGGNSPDDERHGSDAGECVRFTCEGAGAECGYMHDGCGKLLECGICGEGLICGAGGPNRCGDEPACTPRTCEDSWAQCGLIPDGCAGAIECGTCPAGQWCDGSNRCRTDTCYPRSCDRTDCGTKDDGCGGTLECGACPTASTRTILSLQQKDILFDAGRNKLYASVPSTGGTHANSVAVIDPGTGTVERSFFVGSEPGRLAISGDGAFLYVGLDGAGRVAQIDLATETEVGSLRLGTVISGTARALQIAVAPGAPETVIVAQGRNDASYVDSLLLFVDGVQVGEKLSNGRADAIAFGANASTAYGVSSFGDIVTITVDPTAGLSSTPSFGGSRTVEILFHGGKLHLGSGQIVDTATWTLLGTLAAQGSFFHDGNRSYFLPGSLTSFERPVLQVFDTTRFTAIDAIDLGKVDQSVYGPGKPIRIGADRMAFRTAEAIWFVQSDALAAD